MFRTWHALSREQAQAHPFYGTGGWLYVLVAHLALGWALNVSLPLLHPAGFDAAFTSGSAVWWLLYVAVAGAGIVLIVQMMRTKHPKFRIHTTIILVVAGVAALLAFPSVVAPEIGDNLVRWSLYALLWIVYLHRSVRVRVTFEQATNADDPYLDTEREKLSG